MCLYPSTSPSATVSPAGNRRRHLLHKVEVASQDNFRRGPATGFTLVEMLAVLFIIAILVSTLTMAVSKVKSLARQADCKSNLRQIGAALLVYRSDHGGRNPDWLSCLYPTYVDDLHLFVCRSDKNRGAGISRPPEIDPLTTSSGTAYEATKVDDNDSNRTAIGRNTDVHACSYFYEFSRAECPWPTSTPDTNNNNIKEWWEYKEQQLLIGDGANGGGESQPKSYSTSRMPIIRCYHHAREGRIRGHVRETNGCVNVQIESYPITINVAYAGNVYVGPLWWEGSLQPGER